MVERPGWPYFLREIANRYPRDGKFLYVSDGGHWENLGLVELLRRGCTEIVCVNAGGDHQDSFGTIAEAIALAREELSVEIDLDPTPLRPPLEDPPGPPSTIKPQLVVMHPTAVPAVAPAGPPPPPPRELRRQGAKDKREPFAVKSYAQGTFQYLLDPVRFPERTEVVNGVLWLIEPAITADLPFDAHGFAESEPIFPDDSTADQVYNHRQFESFRRLGQHQMEQLFEKVPGLFA